MNTQYLIKIYFSLLLIPLLLSYARAGEAVVPAAAGIKAEQVDVDQIKEKYWARGEESEIGVVQNRTYSKAKKIEFGLLGGIIASDPFLSVKSVGGSLGFHFNEYFSVHALGWGDFVSPSTALMTFEETLGATTNSNFPKWYAGGELSANFLYGKLSLIGKKIIYFDLHLLGGAGATGTDSGKYFTPHAGIGQQFFITQGLSLRVDYRLMRYQETIIEKVITPKLGQAVGDRVNWSNSISFGLDYMIDFFK